MQSEIAAMHCSPLCRTAPNLMWVLVIELACVRPGFILKPILMLPANSDILLNHRLVESSMGNR
jgi:hypothetical protein